MIQRLAVRFEHRARRHSSRLLPAAVALLLVASSCTSSIATQSTTTPAPSTSTTTTSAPATAATSTTPSRPLAAPTSTTSTTSTTIVGARPAATLGDVLFPDLGNAGIDVTHYDLALAWEPLTGVLTATATLDIEAASPLAEFHLDFSGFTIDDLSVNGTSEPFQRRAEDLDITPGLVIPAGTFRTKISYHGVPDAGKDTVGRPLGWLRTPKGAYTLAEPGGAHFWFPSNDHPSDKATYTFHIDVPDPLVAVANGRLTATTSVNGRHVFDYQAQEPMATYLVLVAIGSFRIVETTSATGLPLRSVEPLSWSTPGEYLPVTEKMIDFFSKRFGPYPFNSYGMLFTDSVPDLAMETQTLSMFSADDMHGQRGDDNSFLSHELAHQWFGDAISPVRWNDIWLNESFATYAEWLWTYRDDNDGLHQRAEDSRRTAASDRRQLGSTGHPHRDALFGRQVYDGGAIVLHALRLKVGDDQFFAILQTWFIRFRYRSAGTEDFITVVNEVTGQDLGPFLTQWLDDPKPPPFP